MENEFVRMVAENWSRAVMMAAHEIAHFRLDVLAALQATDSEVRSAAVAVLNEANDALAHDAVVTLLDDQDEGVKSEVLEYLQDFSEPRDAGSLLERIGKPGYNAFLLTRALGRLVEFPDGLLDDDDSFQEVEAVKAGWQRALSDAGLL